MAFKDEGPAMVIKQEYPLNHDDNLIKIEEITFVPTEERFLKKDINFERENGRANLSEHTPTDDHDPRKGQVSDNSTIPKHQCTNCDAVFDSVIILQAHTDLKSCTTSKHSKATLNSLGNKCDPDNGTNARNNKLTALKKAHLVRRRYDCELCEEKLVTKELLMEHRWTHTGDRPYECDECEKKFFRKENLAFHKRTHVGGQPFESAEKLSRQKNLKVHNKEHTEESLFKCDLCVKKYSRHKNLVKHKLAHTDDRLYKCDFCERKFLRQNDFKVHKRTHTGDRPYECDLCEMKFGTGGNLTTHRRTHTDERPYKCDLCGKKYTRKTHMRNHKRTHKGDRTHECDVCQKKFYRKENLMMHKQQHTWQHKCDLCEKKFSQKRDLVLHNQIHTGERPYESGVGEKFSRQKNLLEHKRAHTENGHSSEICAEKCCRCSQAKRTPNTNCNIKIQ